MAAELTATPSFAPPALPLVDGNGRLWPAGGACDTAGLRAYTIHEQLVSPYRFATSLQARSSSSSSSFPVALAPALALRFRHRPPATLKAFARASQPKAHPCYTRAALARFEARVHP